MDRLKQGALAALGAVVLATIIVVWKYATDAIARLVEDAWCRAAANAEICRFRGYEHFLAWMVIGILTLLIIGLLIDRVSNHFQNRR
jgi:hypothetical protein